MITKVLVSTGNEKFTKQIGEKLIDDVTNLIDQTLKRIPDETRQNIDLAKEKEVYDDLESPGDSLEEMSAMTTVGAMGHMDNSRGQRDEQ